MSRVDLTRHVTADPASVALLLAGPVAADGADDQRLRLVSRGARAGLVVALPRRDGVGFVADLTLVDGTEQARGTVTVLPAGLPGCDVRVRLEVADGAARPDVVHTFLDALAEQARARAFAA